MHVFYWKSMLENAGFSAKDIPQQWDEYWKFWEKVQDNLRAKGQRSYSMGLSVSSTGTDNYYLFNKFMLSYGTRIVHETEKIPVDNHRSAQNTVGKGWGSPGKTRWA